MRIRSIESGSFYKINFNSYSTNKKADAKDLSQLGFLGGAGLDFGLGERFFIGGEGMFQLRLPSKYLKDLPQTTKLNYGMGPVIKVGVGYKL